MGWLRYKNPKVAESGRLFSTNSGRTESRGGTLLKHIRKATGAVADDWAVRYLTGESLKQIAEDIVSPVTVWNHLRAEG